ncbi:MAG: hypothetical protein QM736_19635 [Vicinamibacterales bacterium]
MEKLFGYVMMLALSIGGFVEQSDAKVAELLRQASAALGGESALARVHSLTATGTVRRAAGDAQLAGDLTLHLQLPDRMLRIDSLSPDGGLTLVSEQGVNGDTLLRSTRTFNAPPGAVIRTPPPPPRGSDAETQAVRAARADLARLVVALLLRAPESQPLDFSDGGQAESPDGTADVVDVKGRDGNAFAAKLFLDASSHRPLMLSYRGVAPRMVIQTQRLQRGATPPDARQDPPPSLPSGDVVDIDLFLDDYRPVNGLLLPHHITRSVGGDVTEEWTFTAMQINPTFKSGTFDPH